MSTFKLAVNAFWRDALTKRAQKHYNSAQDHKEFTRVIGHNIEGLHDAVRTYARTIFQNLLVSFCTAQYGEKQQKPPELSIYFMEGFEISSKCMC